MEKTYYVYILFDTRKPGSFIYGQYTFPYEPFYIGYGHGRRDKSHFRDSGVKYDANPHKIHIISLLKSLDLPLLSERVYENLSVENAKELEKELILLIGREDIGNGPLTNMTDGGDGILSLSESSRQKIAEKAKGRVVSEEQRQKYSEMFQGENNPHYGKTHSDETREIISQRVLEAFENPEVRLKLSTGKMGIKPSEESNRKRSETLKEVLASPDIKKKMSDSLKGDKNHFYGRTHSPEAIEKIRQAALLQAQRRREKKLLQSSAEN